MPLHRNASRILIEVRQGDGTITVGEEPPVCLVLGNIVQLDPHAPHALVAGVEGMIVEVHLIADCCSTC
jgi:hypothetical protein